MIFFTTGFILLSILFSTATSANSALAQVKTMLKETGTTEQIEEIAQYAQQEIIRRKTAIPKKEYQRLTKLFKHNYNASSLLTTATQTFLSHYDQNIFSDWQKRLHSPLMKTMAQLEKTAKQNDAFPDIIKFAKTLALQPADRLKLMKKLDDVTRVSELALKTQIAINRTLLIAINPSLPDNKQLSTVQMNTILDSLRQQLTSEIKTISLATHFYTYREISNPKLKSYIDQFQSNSGKKIIELRSIAILSALKIAVSRMKREQEFHSTATAEVPMHSTWPTVENSDKGRHNNKKYFYLTMI